MDLLKAHGYGASAQSAADLESLIVQYQISADGNVNAGDLCEFINGNQLRKTFNQTQTAVFTQLTQFNNYYPWDPNYYAATVLSDTTVLIAYMQYIPGQSDFRYYVVLTITGVNISLGTPWQLSSEPNTLATYDSLCKLDNTHYLDLLRTNGNPGLLIPTIVQVTGTTINGVTAQTNCSVGSGQIQDMQIVKLDANNFIILYNLYLSNNNLYALPLQVSNTFQFTFGTPVLVYNGSVGCLRALGIGGGKAVLSFCYYSGSYVPALACVLSLSGLTLTVGTVVSLCSDYGDQHSNDWIQLDATHVLALYYRGSPTKLTIFSISGTTLSAVTTSTAYTTFLSYNMFTDAFKIDATHIALVFCGQSSPYSIYAVVFSISTTYAITSGTPVLLFQGYSTQSPVAMRSCMLNNGCILSLYIEQQSTGQATFGFIFGFTDGQPSLTATLHAKSPSVVALAGGTPGTTISALSKGVAKGLPGLNPGKVYYCDDNGNLTTTSGAKKIGVAISATELLVKYVLEGGR